jgi:hypothetical protein
MWKFIGDGTIPGIESRDYEDDEFLEVQARYEAGFPAEKTGMLERSGMWRHYGQKVKEADRKEAAAKVEAEHEEAEVDEHE